MRTSKTRTTAVILAVLVAALAWPPHAGAVPASVTTLRYDLVEFDLGIAGLEFTQDFLFPTEPVEIVSTRLHFDYDTTAGDFSAEDIALALQPPIADPDGPGVLTLIVTGADLGWSGSGRFNYHAETDALNGTALPAPPDSGALLYGLTYFNAKRLTDPGDPSPIGGRFLDSWIEVDYVPLDACPDGFPDDRTVVFGDQDSGVPNYDRGDGCTFLDAVSSGEPFDNHGQLVQAVRSLTAEWRADGLLTLQESAAIVAAAARSDVSRG